MKNPFGQAQKSIYGVKKPFYFSQMNQNATEEKIIQVSANYRWMENGHIFLWLLKDICWSLELKPGGIVMIFPTVFVAFYITWRSRAIRAELFHNIAVCCWILANSVWMVGEFFEYDMRPYTATIFGIGIIVLAYYYIFYFRKDRRKEKELNLEIETGSEFKTLP